MAWQYEFGAGVMKAVPSLTLAGTVVANPTPVNFGGLQDVAIDVPFSFKELYGQYSYPLAVGRGTSKPTIKAKMARINSAAFNLIFGETSVTAATESKMAFNEAATIPTSSTYTVTVTHSSGFSEDLGVIYASDMSEFTCGTSLAKGIYEVATTGVYTFDSSDKSTAIQISYAYTTTSAAGKIITVSNPLIGQAPYFETHFRQSFEGNDFYVRFKKCVAGKISFGSKLEDFNIPEIDISMMADASNYLCDVSWTQG
jgi:hypothetical protein